MAQKIFQVDAFSKKPFGGNPAAVCILPEAASEEWMQNVAREMNLSETAFLVKRDDGYDLRWFTPAVEVELCGHATLASAHVLFEAGLLMPQEEARFRTKSGLLTARQRDDMIELNFPATPAHAVDAPADLIPAIGATPTFFGQNEFDYLLEVETEEDVRNLAPDFTRLKTLGGRGVMVTSRATGSDYDFVSRFFAPGAGIDEDPVTGSAHCCLGPYWADKLGKSELTAYQASTRGGMVYLTVDGSDRVRLAGYAVTVMRAELIID